MRGSILPVFVLCTVFSTWAKTIVITVGGNTTAKDATNVFLPNNIVAHDGDVVVFTFTQGNHTATQSTFAVPCIRDHDTDITLNGFNSDYRDAGNGTAITTLPVTITNSKETIWFYDANTCAEGGVGVINANGTSTETLEGFQRNAKRLNGTSSEPSTATLSGTQTGVATSSGANPSSTSGTNDAPRIAVHGAAVLVLAFSIAVSSL